MMFLTIERLFLFKPPIVPATELGEAVAPPGTIDTKRKRGG